jgi:hypothetical protein
MFRESWCPGVREGARQAGCPWMGRAVRLGSFADGVCARPHPRSLVPLARREGVRGKERRARGERRTGVGYACVARRGEQGRTYVCSSERRRLVTEAEVAR